MSKQSNPFSPKVRDRTFLMLLEHEVGFLSTLPTIEFIAPKIGRITKIVNDGIGRHQGKKAMRVGI